MPQARFRDIRAEPLSAAELAELLTRFGDKAINRASTTWRKLPEEERELPEVELLTRHPTAMKRPVIHAGGEVHLGFSAAVQAALGLVQVSEQFQIARRGPAVAP